MHLQNCSTCEDLKKKRPTETGIDISPHSSSMFHLRYHQRPVFEHIAKAPVSLRHEVDRETQLAASLRRLRPANRRIDSIRVVRDDRDVVPSPQELLVLAWLTVHVCLEQIDHVLLCVRRSRRIRPLSVEWDVLLFVVAVQEPHNVRRRGTVCDCG